MTTSSNRPAPESTGDPGTVQTDLLRFLEKRTGRVWATDADVFGTGGLSSLFAMELVVHLERTYGISVRGADLRMENFRTVLQMAALVERLRPPASGGPGA
ncbi:MULTISPECIES: acyl carrier protein [Streptomyces]|uniref:Methoxymalonate biosynthesis acyl carrier protein n=1 Tax=Streptomyces clavifer TaxID=68188 RepID=A0ABS4VF82_9ACTN|nr:MULTISPECIES: acyl carrier protein [Streptomyces]KQX89634.1 methoxymalonate biosynthesis protein [Streptomyces sp. Root1319]KQZ20677.1 methoxymalonate biosynthesis protein [Streptomyces sp. Root55]MBP2362583.1 methoxymalonate biosynthesis acyl carrier protein [Streptomyces clavifer]MDX2745221.1 acyl carrier protein [Streptomyces sp. NRRL_B-2557]MDX3062521.1 acyl carrier protein [Streptomyces sp. ND04-05B]